jgi:hypothetical protein
MIERLTDMPAGTLGFRVNGDVQRSDYTDVLVPGLHAAVDGGDGLRTLYLIEDLDELEPSALWEDARTGFNLGVRHHDQWRRSAIVTDQEWLARAARMFVWMIPGEARIYPVGGLEQAKAWVAG